MNKMICRIALALAVASLAGCGLKGPLYFPPQEQPKQQTTDGSDQSSAMPGGTTSGTSTDQRSAPLSSVDGTASGTSATEPDMQSAQ